MAICGTAPLAPRQGRLTAVGQQQSFASDRFRVDSQQMRTPSRSMPKLHRHKAGLSIRVLFWAIVGSLLAWLLATHPKLTLAALFLLACGHFLDTRLQKRRLRALAAQRVGESICEFARSFDPRAIDTWVVRAVYEQLQDNVAPYFPHFPLRASDPLSKPLIFDQDDLDLTLVPEIAERTGRSLHGIEANPYFGKVKTVRDLVLFFNAQPLRNPVEAVARLGAG